MVVDIIKDGYGSMRVNALSQVAGAGAAGDDDPRNGIALVPDMHWAMDHHLIAPGPDLRWHVGAPLDRRSDDLRALCDLEGR